jgi:hypothetical protein
MYALRERRQYVGQEDFEMAIAKVSHGRSGFGSVLQRETKTVLLLRMVGPQEERRG